ncbi:hypothetical protein CERSUDRAFT_116278 [Gelatoporia subvermispora B]|uniref:Pentacotripeptide-repeat region of PRORP domain-containing protein n=1 Tax=Ceriporiopsis subvermispora (strain B) TaxID=914234 RepID=M2QEQ6_CERS8|nr:hypothetical protein CERSUDRAFT_116278 [Gelatoporia subvermispora B]
MASWPISHSLYSPLVRTSARLALPSWATRTRILSSLKSIAYDQACTIETPTMQELKKMPYPSTPLDTSIFEEPSGEYHELSAGREPYVGVSKPQGSNHLLLQLIQEGRFDDADQVYADLTALGADIPPDVIFSKAAKHVLHSWRQSHKERLVPFTRWWSLIPDTSSEQYDIRPIQSIILNETQPDLPLMTEFALIATRKGYGSQVSAALVKKVFRYAASAMSVGFLTALHQALVKNVDPDALYGQVRRRYRYRLRLWYSAAVHSLMSAKMIPQAVEVMSLTRERGVSLSPKLYPSILRKLREATDMERLQLVQDMYRTQFSLDADSPLPFKISSPRSSSPAEDILPAGQAARFSNRPSLSGALRAIRHSFRHGKAVPSPSSLATFIAAYQAQSQHAPKIIKILRRRARKNYFTLSMWALAEMLVHERAGEREKCIWTFNQYFHLIAVPNRIPHFVMRLHRRAARSRRASPYQPEFTLPRIPRLKMKMWPMPHHTAVIWRCAIKGARNKEYLELMYRSFLARVEQSKKEDGLRHVLTPVVVRGLERKQKSPPPALDTLDMLELDEVDYFRPVPSALSYDAGHFNAFASEFARRFGPRRAARVLVDMHRLSVKPNVYTYTIIIDAFAQTGKRDLILAMLGRMERDISSPSGLQTDPYADSYQWLNGSFSYPNANVVTYTAAIVWFVKLEQWQDAAILAERLFEKLKYAPGTNAYIDEYLLQLATHVPRVRDLMGDFTWPDLPTRPTPAWARASTPDPITDPTPAPSSLSNRLRVLRE